ncbi:MAG: hypothetical protein JWQ01_2360 [Massilia sp.]|jgi:hypothetical protein|nr:hypothetical protein [Massilia sp.]
MNEVQRRSIAYFASLLVFTHHATGGTLETENQIDVGIRFTAEDDMVVAHLRFENRGYRPALVLRGMNGVGYPTGPRRDMLGTTANQEFSIHCSGIPVRYVGKIAIWAPFPRTRFELMEPGAVYDIRAVRLDNIYRLPDGAHTCTIVHTHYEFDDTREEAYPVGSRSFEFSYVK